MNKEAKKTIESIIENGVIEAIFERGWVEQTPDEFLYQAKEEILPYFRKLDIRLKPEELNTMIFDALSEALGEEYDVNIYRLKFFPSERSQTYDF